MTKKYRNLWVFGPSMCKPNYCVDAPDSFWGLTARELSVDKVYNCAWQGDPLDSITQKLIGQQEQYDWSSDFFLIAFSMLERLTLFDGHKDTKSIGQQFDSSWNGTKFEIDCHHGLITESYRADKFLSNHYERSWIESQTLKTIFLLNTWLDSVGANYLIVNAGKPLQLMPSWKPSIFIQDFCEKHPRNILFDKTLYSVNYERNQPVDFDVYGWDGHPGAVGHRCFYDESVLPKLQECKLV